jgi:activator of HSP90 ATPase
MNKTKQAQEPGHLRTRRGVIVAAAMAVGALATGGWIWAQAAQQTMKRIPSTPGSEKLTALHQEMALKATPQRIYEALLDSKKFAAFSGAPAEIDAKDGGPFAMFAGQIVGRNVELVANQRIVQAWRPTHWDAGFYSIVEFQLKPEDAGTLVILDHKGFPEGDFDHLTEGWNGHYWEPLKKYFA